MDDQESAEYVYLMTVGTPEEDEIVGIFRTMADAQQDAQRATARQGATVLTWTIADGGNTSEAALPHGDGAYTIVRWPLEGA